MLTITIQGQRHPAATHAAAQQLWYDLVASAGLSSSDHHVTCGNIHRNGKKVGWMAQNGKLFTGNCKDPKEQTTWEALAGQ